MLRLNEAHDPSSPTQPQFCLCLYSTRFVLSCICLYALYCQLVFILNRSSSYRSLLCSLNLFFSGLVVFRFSELDFLCPLAPTRPMVNHIVWKTGPRDISVVFKEGLV